MADVPLSAVATTIVEDGAPLLFSIIYFQGASTGASIETEIEYIESISTPSPTSTSPPTSTSSSLQDLTIIITSTSSSPQDLTIVITSTDSSLLASSLILVSTTSSLPVPPLPASSTSISSTINPTSPTPVPGRLSTSAKIGIGLGVPLGVIVLAIVAFLGYLYGKRRGNKRNAIPAADEQFHGFPGDKDPSAMQGQDGAGAVGPQQPDDDGGLPRYAEELQGSPGIKRHELPAQREAAGYFSPDVITS